MRSNFISQNYRLLVLQTEAMTKRNKQRNKIINGTVVWRARQWYEHVFFSLLLGWQSCHMTIRGTILKGFRATFFFVDIMILLICKDRHGNKDR